MVEVANLRRMAESSLATVCDAGRCVVQSFRCLMNATLTLLLWPPLHFSRT